MDHVLQTTRDAGVRVLVLTMDSPLAGNREYMYRNGFQPGMTNARTYRDILLAPHWMFGTLLRYMVNGGLPEIADLPEGHRVFFGKRNTGAAFPADDFSWDNVRELRRSWQDILVLKGLSTVEDAQIAMNLGVDGIIVSNHGGRSLDGCIPSFAALPAIVDAVAPRVTVMVDGGFKRGADILKAVAVGASSVMVGRATVFGLAAGGQAGVSRALSLLGQETSRALAMIGRTSISQVDRSMLTPL